MCNHTTVSNKAISEYSIAYIHKYYERSWIHNCRRPTTCHETRHWLPTCTHAHVHRTGATYTCMCRCIGRYPNVELYALPYTRVCKRCMCVHVCDNIDRDTVGHGNIHAYIHTVKSRKDVACNYAMRNERWERRLIIVVLCLLPTKLIVLSYHTWCTQHPESLRASACYRRLSMFPQHRHHDAEHSCRQLSKYFASFLIHIRPEFFHCSTW